MTPNLIQIDEATKALVEGAAKQAGISPSELVEQVLRDRLATRSASAKRPRLISPTVTRKMPQDEWRQFVARIAGSIPDPTFCRHDQGRLEDVEELE